MFKFLIKCLHLKELAGAVATYHGQGVSIEIQIAAFSENKFLTKISNYHRSRFEVGICGFNPQVQITTTIYPLR